LALIAVAAACHGAGLKLAPQPQDVTVTQGQFMWTGDVRLALAQPGREDDKFAAEQLKQEMRRCFDIVPAQDGQGPSVLIGLLGDAPVQQQTTGLDLGKLSDRGPDAYALWVRPEGIIAAGNAPSGTFYAIQTLKQLLRANAQDGGIPCVRVLDWPGLRYRGYSDDISRGPIPTMEFFKRQIRTMAEFKMNMLTFYTEHVFKLAKHPVIAPDDGLTAQQAGELSRYARKYHVELVGNFQSFGHFANILKHEQYAHLRETTWVITPAKEESYTFLDEVYSEIAPAYDSKLFNVNCDETWGLGTGPSKALADEIGVGAVYLGHMNRIHDILRDNYGKRMMMWGDIALQHPEIVDQLAKDTILLSWGYGARTNYDSAIEPFVKAGLEFMVCPGVSCWSRIFPHYENALVNIRNYVRDGAKFGAIGMLNTTWDDYGENLFHWNFYGTNWGGVCAWRPSDADPEAFNEAYAQVSYGTADDKVTRAIGLLASCVHNPLTRGNMDPAFYVKPFGALATSFDLVMDQAADLCQRSQEAINLLRQARMEAKLDAEDLAYIEFAARRLHYIGRARELQLGMAKEYTEAVAQYPDAEPARRSLGRAISAANELLGTVRTLQADYRTLWLAENRPWWLDRMAGKYDGLISTLASQVDKLKAAGEEFDKTGIPPDPESVGLQLAETTRRDVKAVPSKEPILAQDATWWDKRWPYRIPLMVANGKTRRTDYTAEVLVNFGTQKVDEASLRVVAHMADNRTQVLPTQFDPVAGGGHVVFVLPGVMEPEARHKLALYYDVVGGSPKPAQKLEGVSLRRDGSWWWVESSKYKVLVGRSGAHLFEWYVKALGNLEITHPGRGGWSGFADAGDSGGRAAAYDITCEAAGPVMVRLRATAPSAASEKLFSFYAGKPYAEVMLANPTNFYWNYDNVNNFAKDKGNPGMAVFSNGHKEPVCRSDEQVHAEAKGVTWSAKTREDGLLLANITPEVKATHMTGPGAGWGGVGIERSVPVWHFVIYADKVDGDIAPVLNEARQTLDMREQPKVYVGRGQKAAEG